MKQLKGYLKTLPPGPVRETKELEDLLSSCWDDFEEDPGESSGMEGYKLHGRMEQVVWSKPLLSFTMERHGGTVLGSSRAELQSWTLNVDTGHRSLSEAGHRQLGKMQPRLDVRPLVEKVASLVGSRQEDPCIKWYPDGRVRVLIGEIIPERSASKMTTVGRRKRFWEALDERLGPSWRRDRATLIPTG